MISKNTYEIIIHDIQSYLLKCSEKHDFRWFYDLHQLEVVKSAEMILENYPDADRGIVLISCWLHDIMHYLANGEDEIVAVKQNHHLEGAAKARELLSKYQLEDSDVIRIENCIRRHRNKPDYKPQCIEDKIVASADAFAHFYSVFFLTFFKVHPTVPLDEMVELQKEKLERDWRDVNILPEAGELAKPRYLALKSMVFSYKDDFKNFSS